MFNFKGKALRWSEEKNKKLIRERDISFEIVSKKIDLNPGCVLDVIRNNTHPNENMIVLYINNLIYLVPFVERDNEFILKTVFKSRKMTKKYLGRRE